ncbi:MAG TPA: hypothetical protein PLF75_09055, partial [Bacteroidales bacterium]|nr:hypothetical protein [Bacteroidales bacterium]
NLPNRLSTRLKPALVSNWIINLKNLELCLAEENVKDIKWPHTNVKNVLERIAIRKRSRKYLSFEQT